jgi:hypothetical protein
VNVWGIDSAAYYSEEPRATENFAANVRARVGQQDLGSLNRTALTGSNTRFDAVITESVMEGYAPGEQDAILAACEAQWAAPNRPVVHIVFDNVAMSALRGCPARTLAQWQGSTTRTGHTFVSAMGIEGA